MLFKIKFPSQLAKIEFRVTRHTVSPNTGTLIDKSVTIHHCLFCTWKVLSEASMHHWCFCEAWSSINYSLFVNIRVEAWARFIPQSVHQHYDFSLSFKLGHKLNGETNLVLNFKCGIHFPNGQHRNAQGVIFMFVTQFNFFYDILWFGN